VQLLPTPLTDEVDLDGPVDDGAAPAPPKSDLPPGPTQWEPLVLWRAKGACDCDVGEDGGGAHAADCKAPAVRVPDIICRWLRPHQREGVQFMCVWWSLRRLCPALGGALWLTWRWWWRRWWWW
jgi:hypothetical protein